MIAILLFWGLKNGHAQQINDSLKTDEIWQILDSIAKTHDIETTPDSVNKQENPQPKKKPLIEEKYYDFSLPDPRGWEASRRIYYNDTADFQQSVKNITNQIAMRDTLHQIYEEELKKLESEQAISSRELLSNIAIEYLNTTSIPPHNNFVHYVKSPEFAENIATELKMYNYLKTTHDLIPEEIKKIMLVIMIHKMCIEIQNCYRGFRNIAQEINNKLNKRDNHQQKFLYQTCTHMIRYETRSSYLPYKPFVKAVQNYRLNPSMQTRRVILKRYDRRAIRLLECTREVNELF